ncbi:MAG TPA: hypothetical protein VF881_17505 [Polyangiaceae bacterium]
MDCEKFDQIIIDAVYDELDELTLAAAKRHAEGCQRCQAQWSGLRATLKIGVLPLVEAPAGLDARIFHAAREAQRNVPWPKRVGRAISWAGSYAMRPQTAMAAILLLMLGSSVIFLRVKPDRSGAPSRVSVTERGVPEQSAEELHPERFATPEERARGMRAQPTGPGWRREDERPSASAAPFAASPPPAVAMRDTARESEAPIEGRATRGLDKGAAPSDDLALNAPAEKKKSELSGAPVAAGALAPSTGDAYASAMDLYTAGRYAEAEKAFADVAATGSKNAALAALYSAKSAQAAFGCGKAASKYEAVANRYSGTSAGAEALWGAASCYKEISWYPKARELFESLRTVAGYRDRAEAELESLNILQRQIAVRRAPAAKPAAPAATAAPKNATTPALK